MIYSRHDSCLSCLAEVRLRQGCAEKKDAEGSKAGLLSRCAAASQVFVDIVLRHLKP